MSMSISTSMGLSLSISTSISINESDQSDRGDKKKNLISAPLIKDAVARLRSESDGRAAPVGAQERGWSDSGVFFVSIMEKSV